MKIVEGMVSRKSRRDSANLLSGSKRSAGLLLALTLIFGVLPATPSLAENCAKANAVKVVSGVKFVCKKTGGKLQWVRQGSNAVVNNQPTSPSTTTVREWTKCPAAGRVSGSGERGFTCVRVKGTLQWVRNATLDLPIPDRPCRSQGLIGDWRGEVVLCTPSRLGNTWQVPQFDEDSGSLPGDQGTLTQYRFTVPGWCHGTSVPVAIEVQEGSGWRQVPAAISHTRASCTAGNGVVNATVDLAPGSVVRLRVFVKEWSWISAPSTLGVARDVVLTYAATIATPTSTRVTLTPIIPATGNFRLEFVSYQWVGDEAVFTFKPAAYTKSILFRSATNFSTARGSAPIAGQPRFGTWIHFTDQLEIRVKQSAVQWDLARFEFDLNGDDNGVPYTFRVTTDFTWR